MSSKTYNFNNLYGCSFEYRDNMVIISGCIDDSQPGKFMKPFFDDVHTHITSKKIKEIIIDIKNLVFLNSSGIKEFVSWILKVEVLPKEKLYKLGFVGNKNKIWQQFSLETLKLLSPEIINFTLEH